MSNFVETQKHLPFREADNVIRFLDSDIENLTNSSVDCRSSLNEVLLKYIYYDNPHLCEQDHLTTMSFDQLMDSSSSFRYYVSLDERTVEEDAPRKRRRTEDENSAQFYICSKSAVASYSQQQLFRLFVWSVVIREWWRNHAARQSFLLSQRKEVLYVSRWSPIFQLAGVDGTVRFETALPQQPQNNSQWQMHLDSIPSSDAKRSFMQSYNLFNELGKGGYGVVHRATHKQDGSSYAIKILNRKKMDKKHEDGLRHEVKIMMDLNHPNIVKAYDLFEEPESFYVVMELITGGELFDRIVRKTCYKEAEARQLARTLLGAIKYMHDNNIVHRDLKPENLLLTSEKNDFDIKVVDFGFATEVDGDNLRAHCGTPGYIAPEILKDLPYGKSVDMWSFGVILYILLGGYPPFYDKNQQLLFRKIMKGAYVFHPEYWQEVSDEGKDLIRKLLVVDVPSRLTVEQALAHPWFAGEEELLQKRVLTYGLSELRKFTARRKLRAGIRSVLALKRMQTLASASLRERQMEMALSSIGESSVEEEDDPKSSEVAAAEPVKG